MSPQDLSSAFETLSARGVTYDEAYVITTVSEPSREPATPSVANDPQVGSRNPRSLLTRPLGGDDVTNSRARETITATQAADLYGDGEGRDGEQVAGWTQIGDVAGAAHYSRQSRWHDRYWLLVRNEQGETYGVEYGIGLTEDQEDDLPWEGVPANHELRLTRLSPHTVTRVEYRPTPAEVSG